MRRTLFLVYGLIGYLLFLLVFAWLMAFVGNFGLPRTIDRGPTTSLPVAITVNSVLVLVFGLQHSVMARPAFKRWWTQYVPQPIERSTYVFVSAAVTALLILLWQPIPIVVWHVEQPILRAALWALFFAGWLLVPVVSLMINHFDLFGLRQVWLHWRDQKDTSLSFRTPWLYAKMRHPLYVGWMIAFFATPTMTVGHLLLASLMTVYMLVAIVFEERDLVAHFGEEYKTYQRTVPMFGWRMQRSPERLPQVSRD